MGNQQNKQANDFFRNMATAASITSSFVQKKSTVVGDPVNAPAPSSSFTIAHSLASWVVDGLTAHAADLLASPDAATELTIRELCNELIDVNVGTQRISTLLLYCCDLLDQVIAVTTPPPPPSANASSSGAVSGEGRGGGTGTNDSKGHVNATSSSSGKTNASLPDALVRSTQVALRLCQTILRHAIRASQGDSILLLKMLDGGSARQSVPSSSMKYLELLVEFVLRVPLGPSTLVLHWEATDSLVVLCSTALYHSPRPASTSSSGDPSSSSNDNSDALFHADIFTESILTLDVIRPLIAILVQRVVAWGVKLMPETAFQYRIHKGPSFRNMYGLYGANVQDWSSVADLLGRSSAQLLSILAFHVPLFQNEAQVVAAFLTLSGCPPTVESTNGNQQQVGHSAAAAATAADKGDLAGASQRTPPPKPPTHRSSSTEEEGERPRSVVIEILAQLVSGEHIHFDLLLHAMRDKMLSTPILALLFYAFLWHHPTFLHNALSHETWRMLLLDVAWEVLLLSSASSTLHYTTHHHPAAAAASPPTDTVVQTFQNLYLQYVSASILSLLSQDKTFHTLSFQTRVREPATLVAAAAQSLTGKLTETGSAAFLVQSITIGSGAIVLCCRGILRSLPLDASQQSVDLAKLYLSFLRNSSPFVHDIHHFAAQKIVSTLRVLTKRFLKIKSSIEAVYQEGRQRIEEENGASIQDAVPYALLAEAETLLTFLVGLFDAVVTMLDGSHPNHSLTCELLYHRAALDLDDPHTTTTTKPQTSSNSHSTATAVENLSLVTTATTGSSSFTSLDTTQPKMLVETAHDADFFIGPLLRKLRATKRPILELLRQYDIEMASVAMNHSPDDILKLIIRVSGSTMAHALSSVTHDEDGDHDAMSASTSSSDAYSDLDADSVLGEEAKEIEARRQRALKAEREEKHALYRIRRRRDAVYVYREEPHANALFFTPTVWATIVSESPKVGSPHWVVTPEEIGKLRLFYS